MKKSRLACALALTAMLASCAAGPHQLRRTVDDWDQSMYVKSPWMDAVLWVVPVIPLAWNLAWIGDFLVTDGYTFWFKDAWDGKGTAFTHYEVKPTDGAMGSLMMDDAHWLAVK